MRTLNHCLIVAVSALVTLGLACSGDDNASESDSTTTAPTSSTGGSSSTAATSTGETSGGGTGQCIPDQDPCGADCCNPGESCVDGMCVSDQSTGSTGTTGTTGTTGDVCNPDQTECGDDCCDVTEMCVDNACVPMTTDGSTEEVVSLAIPSAWTPSAPADDPFLDERPADVACATGWGEEGGLFEVNTDACAYGAFTQPSLASIEPGDAIELVLVHDALAADAPATAHVALAIGDAIAWTESIAIPGEADILRPQWVADEAQPVGAPLHFHVHNHGANSYRLVALTRTRAP